MNVLGHLANSMVLLDSISYGEKRYSALSNALNALECALEHISNMNNMDYDLERMIDRASVCLRIYADSIGSNDAKVEYDGMSYFYEARMSVVCALRIVEQPIG